MVELVTNVPTLEVLSKCSVEPYDAIYLGNPYCWDYDGNLISNFNDLEVAIEMLKEMGKKVYITTFAAPRNGQKSLHHNICCSKKCRLAKNFQAD